MINILVGVAKAPDAPPSARVTAACAILDRGWGRPDQVHAGADGGPIQVIIRQIIDITGQSSEPVVINHEPELIEHDEE